MDLLLAALLISSVQAAPTQHDIQQRLEQQKAVLASKPSTAFLGRNGDKRKKKIINRIHQLESQLKRAE